MKSNCRYVLPFLLTCMLLFSGCASMPLSNVDKRSSTALPAATDTPTARYVQAELAGHNGDSGFRLLSLSTNALLSRITLADHAKHSIDLQYYIYKNDATGRLFTQHLLAAADRGVRVRLLLDHNSVDKQVEMLEALDAHENIEVRLFNPFRTKRPSIPSKVAQLLLEGPRLNRRMHNKSFIVDGVVAVIGGRNIGDDYFDAGSDTRFRDLDLIAIGAVVNAASNSFDAYWNSDAAFPLAAFPTAHGTKHDTAQLRASLAQDVRQFEDSDYAKAALEELPQGPSADRFGTWFWGPAEFVADSPEKIKSRHDQQALEVGTKVKTLMQSANKDLLLLSPYFIPGKNGTRLLQAHAKRGVRVKVLTNSLASNDEPLVHAAYVHYRHDLLESGVELYELRPSPGTEQAATNYGASSGVALHAKAMVVDDSTVLIGSMNLDPRSRLINTEMGLIVHSAQLARAVTQFFDTAADPANAWQVHLPGTGRGLHRLVWTCTDNGKPQQTNTEPGASTRRRMQVMLMRLLPIDNLL